MENEIAAAVDWWATELRYSLGLPVAATSVAKTNTGNSEPLVLCEFRRALGAELSARFAGHWHVREPHRGSAYRSLSGGHKLDPVIARAGEAAGLQAARLESMLAHTSGITVFVNPGEVKTVRAGKQRATRVLYARPSLSGNDRPADSTDTQYEGAFMSTDQSAQACQHESPPITAGADSPLLRTTTPPPHLSLSSSSTSSSSAGQTGAEMDLSQLRMAVDSLASAAQRSILSPKSTVFVPRFTA